MRTSFFVKIAGIFVAMIVTLGVVIALISVRAAVRVATEAEQKLNAPLASELAREFEPLLVDAINEDSLRNQIAYVLGINPRIELYLIGSDGSIKTSFLDDGEPVVDAIPTAALDAFLAGETLPILGPDPRNPSRSKPFSVANIAIMGEGGCYLYVILGGQRYTSAASMVRDSYMMRAALRGLGLVVLVTGIGGVLLFFFLTKRLREIEETVRGFADGDYSRRARVDSSDEFGRLGASFNLMADRLTSTMDDLKRTDRLRRELVANVSHDLRSPLASIRGYVETILLRNEQLTEQEKSDYLRIVLNNTESLSDLVAALFELSRLDASQVTPSLEPFPVAELVQDVVLQFAPMAESAGVTLTAVLPDTTAVAVGDIGLVERALSNLIDNAIRFTPRGGTVRVLPTVADGTVTISVEDTGVGIPPEELPHIFDRFYRIEKSRTRDGGGSGLGLAIAQKIVRLHGSDVDVRRAPSGGTVFSFTLASAK